MPDLPTGTVTFLYTDIEGSTLRWEQHPDVMKRVVERHDALLQEAIEAAGGVVFRRMGDAFCAAFPLASQGVDAVLAGQSALHAESWDQRVAPIRVRMALHAGRGEVRDGDYVGAHLNRIARLLSTGYGGQTLLTQAAYELVCDSLPQGVSLLDLGQHRLKDLQRPEHVYQLVSPHLPADFPPIKTLSTRPNNLPPQPTEFIGREKEVEEASQLLGRPQVRLVTFTGPGGTGKTRLSLQVGGTFLERLQDGVFFVPLTTISDHTLVPTACAEALGMPESTGRPPVDALRDYLRQKELLLVLDNFEQVMGATTMISDLLPAAPQLKVLVTSREVLHIYGEKEFPVSPLRMPDPRRLPPLRELAGYESVRLFVERATSVKPGFELTEENAAAIAELCHRLDGLPLAIELAAARIKLLSPQAILSRLESRLKLLTSGSRDLPARQQTLRGAIDWSYDLLSPDERILFRRLAVFKGSCTLEAAEAVCQMRSAEFGVRNGKDEEASHIPHSALRTPHSIDVLDGLASLVDKSLLRQSETDDGDPRFGMLETIREYALERLEEAGEVNAICAAHADYYMQLAEQAERYIHTSKQQSALDSIEVEHENIRAAIEWSITSEESKETGLRIGIALCRFWHIRGHMGEGRRWMEALLSRTEGRTKLRANALHATGYMTFLLGDLPVARRFLEESVSIAQEIGDDITLAYPLFMLGAVTGFGGDPAEGSALAARGIALFRKAGDRGGPGLNLGLLVAGVLAFTQGDYAATGVILGESRAVSKELGDKYTLAQASTYLGDVARMECDYPRARLLYEEALAIFNAQRGRGDIPALLHNLGYVAVAERDYSRARALFRESMALQQEIANKQGISECLTGFAAIAGAEGNPQRAARLFGASETLRLSIGVYMWPAERIEWDRNMSVAKAQLDEIAWQEAWDAGCAMTMEEAIVYALEDRR
ncbi:MAG TPA: NB-ARC domain-containing protein [Chloroflexia bacterium]|nr:NB-ARC domain-containing protein [Chloroflexia bacterium]